MRERIEELTEIVDNWSAYWEHNKCNLYKTERMSDKQAKAMFGIHKTTKDVEKHYKEREQKEKVYWKKHFKKLLNLNTRLEEYDLITVIKQWKKEQLYGSNI